MLCINGILLSPFCCLTYFFQPLIPSKTSFVNIFIWPFGRFSVFSQSNI